MAVTLNKANLVLKDANGNIGKIEQLSDRDLAKIRTAVSDVALVVNQSNHTPIEATTTNKGVVQLATSADVVAGASDKVVTAEQLHNSTTGTSALATENLARIDAVVTEAGIPIDHTNTNQLKTAVTTLISNATPATATANTLGVVKPDNDTITIDSNGVLTATGQMPGVATTTNVGVVKPDGSTITIDGNGTLTATSQMPGVATTTNVGVVKPDGSTITIDGNGTLTATAQMPSVATASTVGVVKPDGSTITINSNGVLTATKATNADNATNLGGYPATDYVRSVNGTTPDDSGNVTIDAGGVIKVNGIAPDASGNIKIDTKGLNCIFNQDLVTAYIDGDKRYDVAVGDTFTIKVSENKPIFIYCGLWGYMYYGTQIATGTIGVRVTLKWTNNEDSPTYSYSTNLKNNSAPMLIPMVFDYSYLIVTITSLPTITPNFPSGHSTGPLILGLYVAQ